MCASGKHHVLSVNITKVNFQTPFITYSWPCDKFVDGCGCPNMCASGKHHVLSVNITKVEFQRPLNFTE